ncbi:hypothetical protein N0V90_003362 [Kalmusia sp. IMI 367209]|nr:hypothetical protein N0V90_003362 [Kalmusia sp. IMI 367209]
MAAPLQVIALISGGKDSLFSILHCLANGHHVVALANLHPSPQQAGDDEDINSYMYQTVGASVIPLYEEALGIPLFRQEITGSAVTHSRDYSTQDADETEDLVPLLERVKLAHPEANAVSTGAILSTYQRTRVENVAVRLGLTPLSFLWQYPLLPPYIQSSLLTDMHAMGQDARIIKVASGGLDESFLNENVAELRTVARMKKAIGRFSENGDGAVLGEGGEFETLAVDGPSLLWKKKIVLEGEVLRQGGGTAVWKAVARVAEKDSDTLSLANLRKPPTFDDEFLSVLNAPLDTGRVHPIPLEAKASAATIGLPVNGHYKHKNTILISNVVSHMDPSTITPIKYQFANVLCRLKHFLDFYGATKDSITHCTLLLRDMKDFSLINGIYSKFFDFTNPPSRVTVAVGDALEGPTDVMLSVIAHVDCDRNGLHVQSQSYWAPANIGPYSQAISIPLSQRTDDDATRGHEVHIAGQIPLDPASMTLYTKDGFKGEALLALQHLFRIGRTQHVTWWPAGIAMIPASADAQSQEERVRIAQATWASIHNPSTDSAHGTPDEAPEPDAWDRKNFSKAFDDATERAPIPDRRIFDRTSGPHAPPSDRRPPCFVAEVDALPRYASIEWACIGLDVQHVCPSHTQLGNYIHRFSVGPDPDDDIGYFSVEITDAEDGRDVVEEYGCRYGTLYVSPRLKRRDWNLLGIAWVPCKRVWGADGTEVGAVLVGRCGAE